MWSWELNVRNRNPNFTRKVYMKKYLLSQPCGHTCASYTRCPNKSTLDPRSQPSTGTWWRLTQAWTWHRVLHVWHLHRFYLLGILHLHPNLGTTESQWCTQSRFRDGDGRFHSYSTTLGPRLRVESKFVFTSCVFGVRCRAVCKYYKPLDAWKRKTDRTYYLNLGT